MKKVLVFTVIILILSLLSVFAGDENNNRKSETQNTVIKGNVIDKSTGETLSGVFIKLVGTDLTAYSDLEGKFEFNNIKPGKYEITTSYISYENISVEEISHLISETCSLTIGLSPLKN